MVPSDKEMGDEVKVQTSLGARSYEILDIDI